MTLLTHKTLLQADLFWRYSADTYSRPGMKDLCLHCQNTLGLNVNLILLCGWLHVFGKTLSHKQVFNLNQSIQDSDAQLKALRKVRNRCQRDSDAYRDCLKQELKLEGEQQKILLQELAKCALIKVPLTSSKVDHPLALYFSFSGVNTPEMEQDLIAIFAVSKAAWRVVERD